MKFFIAITLFVTVLAVDIDWDKIQQRHVDDPVSFPLKDISAEGRIINGKKALPKQFPYQVGMVVDFGKSMEFCGGTLISKNWIVTAAHCTIDSRGILVFMGTVRMSDSSEPGRLIMDISPNNAIAHEDYNAEKMLNDISVIELPKPVELNDYIKPVNLPKLGESSTYNAEKAIASGWGNAGDGGASVSVNLRWIKVPILSNSICDSFFPGLIEEEHLCIDTDEGKSTCYGDDGGPLVLADGSNTLIGLASFGRKYACDVGYSTVFTRITSYLDWIQETTGVANDN